MPKTPINHAGQRLIIAMEAADISINQLAHETGLSRSTIRNMRMGDMNGSLYSWRLVANHLGVSVSELIGEKWQGLTTKK